MSRRGSAKFVVMKFVSVPGVQRPEYAVQPVYCENLSTARLPYGRCEQTRMSFGFSIATIMRAATMIFSHVLPMLSRCTPSAVRLKQYVRICLSTLRGEDHGCCAHHR